jgi:hypothetical protein
MPVDSFPLPDAAGAPIATPSRQGHQPVESAFEERWSAGVARGRRRDSAVQRKRRLAFIAGVVVVVRGTALSRRFGGAR